MLDRGRKASLSSGRLEYRKLRDLNHSSGHVEVRILCGFPWVSWVLSRLFVWSLDRYAWICTGMLLKMGPKLCEIEVKTLCFPACRR